MDSLVDIIDKASFSVDTGELIALIAPSGAGENITYDDRMCEEPTSGQIWFGDEKVYDNKWLKIQEPDLETKNNLFFKHIIFIPF